MPQKNFISVSEAIKFARSMGINISRVTVLKYIESHNYGHQIGGKGGRWFIHKERYRRFICGKNEKYSKDCGTDQEQGCEEAQQI
jgi:hypothetical protein